MPPSLPSMYSAHKMGEKVRKCDPYPWEMWLCQGGPEDFYFCSDPGGGDSHWAQAVGEASMQKQRLQ